AIEALDGLDPRARHESVTHWFAQRDEIHGAIDLAIEVPPWRIARLGESVGVARVIDDLDALAGMALRCVRQIDHVRDVVVGAVERALAVHDDVVDAVELAKQPAVRRGESLEAGAIVELLDAARPRGQAIETRDRDAVERIAALAQRVDDGGARG